MDNTGILKNNSTISNSERNYGIDLLRIIATIMIVVLHVVTQSHIKKMIIPLSPAYNTAYFLEIFSYSVVNIYALISGYVGVNQKFRFHKIVSLWLEVFFYSVLLTFMGHLLSPETVTLKMLIRSFFPLRNSELWYFQAYVGVFCLTPLFNYILNSLSKETLKKVILSMILLFSVLPALLVDFNLFTLKTGFSTLWLSVLYMVGGYIKKYKPSKKDRQAVYILGFFMCVIINFFYFFVTSILTNKLFGQIMYSYIHNMIKYNSPVVFMQGLFAFMFFSNIKIRNKTLAKIIVLFSSATFGVYAIHENPVILRSIIVNIRTSRNIHSLELFIYIIAISLVIYLICSIIDIIRIQLFKLCRIKRFSMKISELAERLFNWIMKKSSDVI